MASRLPTSMTSVFQGPGGGPLYRKAKLALMHALESGEFPAGSALPSESALAKSLGISIGTLRHAVDELVAEHMLVRHQGRGTFVSVHGTDRSLFHFFHVERSDGLRDLPQVECVSFQRTWAGDDAAEALGMQPQDPAWQIENRLSLQKRVVVYDRIVIPARLFKGLTERRFRERPSTVYHLYQTEFGITVVQAQERASAVAADRTAARMLGLGVGTPVMQIRRTAYTFGQRPVEYRVSTVHTAHHEYVQMLLRPF